MKKQGQQDIIIKDSIVRHIYMYFHGKNVSEACLYFAVTVAWPLFWVIIEFKQNSHFPIYEY